MEYTRTKTIGYRVSKNVPSIGSIDGYVNIHDYPLKETNLEFNHSDMLVAYQPIDYDSIDRGREYYGRIDATFSIPSGYLHLNDSCNDFQMCERYDAAIGAINNIIGLIIHMEDIKDNCHIM